jgi:predicted permease
MTNLILLIVCFLFGVLLRRAGSLPAATPSVLNAFIVYISVPALVLMHVRDMHLSSDVGVVASMGWLYFLLAAICFIALGRWLKLSRATTGALILTAGLGNTSFYGFPMIEAFYGKAGLAVGIIVDQIGSAPVVFTLGIAVAGIYSGTDAGVRGIIKRIVLFPPFIALVAAMLLRPVAYPYWLVSVLERLSDTLAPLALVSVGFQLRLGHLAGNGRNLAIGLAFKLLLAPLLFYGLFVHVLDVKGLTAQVTVFESAMPPMITAGIIAAEHDLDPDLANLMVAVGLLLSFFTLTGWWWVMRGI